MGIVAAVAVFALLPLCRKVTSAPWTFGNNEAGNKHEHSIYGSVVKKGDIFRFHGGLQDGKPSSDMYPRALHTDCGREPGCNALSSARGYRRELCGIAGSVARAQYVDAKYTPSYTGQLHLSTSGSFSDHDQMFAVGYLEGYISAG